MLRLRRLVVQTHQMLESLVDPLGWIDHARRQIADAAEGDLLDSDLGASLVAILRSTIADIRDACARARRIWFHLLGKFPAYPDILTDCAAPSVTGASFSTPTASTRSASTCAITSTAASRAFPIPSPTKMPAKRAVDSVRDAMTKGPLLDLLPLHVPPMAGRLWPRSAARKHVPQTRRSLRRSLPAGQRCLPRRRFRRSRTLRLQGALRHLRVAALLPTDAARAYHRRFAHVLVDEYQDINELQDAILTLLSRECLDDADRPVPTSSASATSSKASTDFRLAEAARFLDRQNLYRDEQLPRAGRSISRPISAAAPRCSEPSTASSSA